MDPERGRQIYELFHAARERSPRERAELLAQADPELRHEVESLLAQQAGDSLLERPAMEAAAKLLADSTITGFTPGE